MKQNAHPYAETLAQKLAARTNRSTSMKLRSVLNGFGYKRRTQPVVDTVLNYLETSGLSAEFSVDAPKSLDDRVTITMEQAPSIEASLPQKESPTVDQDGVSKAVAATVQVLTRSGTGSGFIVHQEGLVITARHVVNNEEGYSLRHVKVRMSSNKDREDLLDAVVIRSHRQLDYALLWLQPEGSFPTMQIGNPAALRHAQTVFAVGSPAGMTNTVSKGIVSNPLALYRNVECVQTDAAIGHGNSGGPLITENGEAVGITLWGEGDFDALKFAVPVDYLKKDIEQAIALGKQKCLDGTYCPACGFLDAGDSTWFCRNCGIQFTQSAAAVVMDEAVEIDPSPDLTKLGIGKSSLVKIQATLDSCNETTRKIFTMLAGNWSMAGGMVRCNSVGRIYIKLDTIASSFNLAVLATPKGDKPARVEITMGTASGNYPYLSHIPEQVAHFEKIVSGLRSFKQEGTIHYIPVSVNVETKDAVILMGAMLNLKKKDDSMSFEVNV
jgi:S1-C subfamily serine protease